MCADFTHGLLDFGSMLWLNMSGSEDKMVANYFYFYETPIFYLLRQTESERCYRFRILFINIF
jgi:hypothetical protein